MTLPELLISMRVHTLFETGCGVLFREFILSRKPHVNLSLDQEFLFKDLLLHAVSRVRFMIESPAESLDLRSG